MYRDYSPLVGKDLPIRLAGGIDGSLDPGRRVCQKRSRDAVSGQLGFFPFSGLYRRRLLDETCSTIAST